MIYSLTGVTKHYFSGCASTIALESISFEVARGEQVAIIGRSGAGKSTLLKLLNGTARISDGSLKFQGKEITGLKCNELRAMRTRIGVIHQQHCLIRSLDALQNTLCGCIGRWSLIHSICALVRPSKREVEQAVHALDAVGLASKYHAKPEELSVGEQQRVAVARMLMQDPEVVLADEPMASLDPRLSVEIGDLILQLTVESRRTVLMSLHNVGFARDRFPRIIALRNGGICFDGPPAELSDELIDYIYIPGDASRSMEPAEQCLSYHAV